MGVEDVQVKEEPLQSTATDEPKMSPYDVISASIDDVINQTLPTIKTTTAEQ